MEEVKNVPIEDQSKSTVEIDYDKINGFITKAVDSEVGKFMKTFLENNRVDNQSDTVNEQDIIDKELREWKI